MSKPIRWAEAKIVKQKTPYEPYTKSPFGITTWAKAGERRVRVYQRVDGEIVWIEVA